MNACIPVIVALEIDKNDKNAHFIFDWNQLCNVNKGIDFSIHIPHITLWMGFVDMNELIPLSISFKKVFGNINFDVFVDRLELYKGIEGNVLSLQVEKSKKLLLLQNRIHHFFEPYRKILISYQKFNPSTVNYVNSFSKKSLDYFDPHITIGFSDENYTLEPFELCLANPKIFLMGNNCTCLEVIST